MPFPFERISLHSLNRIQLPNRNCVTRLIYLARWNPEATCCQNSRNLKWIPVSAACNPSTASNEHRDLVNQFWGSEVASYASYLNSSKLNRLLDSGKIQTGEQTLEEMFKYVEKKSSESEDESEPISETTKMFTEFVTSTKYTDKAVTKLYSDFVQHCYPSVNMSYISYKDYCEKIGLALFLDDARLRKAFQASNYKVKNYITFNEFLLGMVSLDPDAPHTRPRYAFIFRYYDSDSDGSLSQEDMKRLLTDLRRFIEWRMTSATLNLAQFVEEIQTDRLKGTSNLCRSTRSILRLVKSANTYEPISCKNIPVGSEVEANCSKCRPKNYTHAAHSVEMTLAGTMVDPVAVECKDTSDSKFVKLMHEHSMEYLFKSTSYANYVLDLVRKLRQINKMSEQKRREVRNEVVNGLTLNVINGLCDEVSELLQNEARVVQVCTPTFVMGDIHGNINDLLTFETQLWPMAPSTLGPNVLFLGDYVDRGEFSIEVVCYLFSMKLLAPTKVSMQCILYFEIDQ